MKQTSQRLSLSASLCAALTGLGVLTAGTAEAAPSLVIDAATGAVLHQEMATASWYPASLTKLMTAYVALRAAKERRISLETPMVVSARAARMAPSKMGFKPGSEVTLDNALKMIMVKSANDVSVTIAEGISGSVEAFADEMNRHAARLGMSQSRFANPNGLPDQRQVTSARDMAILARALLVEFPEQRDLWGIGAIAIGGRVMPTHNGLMGRYDGADGMKTGFTCSSGFNVVASATRNGRKLIAVVMGSPSARERTVFAAQLFDKGFASGSAQISLAALRAEGPAPAPDMRQDVCVKRNRGVPQEGEDVVLPAAIAANVAHNPAQEFLLQQAGVLRASSATSHQTMMSGPRPVFEPVPVYLGRAPGWTGSVARARSGPAGAPEATTSYAPAANAASPLAPDPKAKPLQLTGASESKGATTAKAVKPAPAPQRTAARPPAKASQKANAAPKQQAGKQQAAKPTPKQAAKPAAKPAKPAPKPAGQ